MARLQITSVKRPFASARIAYEAMLALERAEAMGLLPEGQRIETLDLPVLRSVVGHVRRAGIGTGLVVSDDLMEETAALESLLTRLNRALEESPAPEHEWVRLMDMLGPDLLVRLLGISGSSLRRYRTTTRTTPDPVAARLHFLALVAGDLAGAYNDLGIRQWFGRKRAQLGGRAPVDILVGDWDPGARGLQQLRDLARSLTSAPAT